MTSWQALVRVSTQRHLPEGSSTAMDHRQALLTGIKVTEVLTSLQHPPPLSMNYTRRMPSDDNCPSLKAVSRSADTGGHIVQRHIPSGPQQSWLH